MMSRPNEGQDDPAETPDRAPPPATYQSLLYGNLTAIPGAGAVVSQLGEPVDDTELKCRALAAAVTAARSNLDKYGRLLPSADPPNLETPAASSCTGPTALSRPSPIPTTPLHRHR